MSWRAGLLIAIIGEVPGSNVAVAQHAAASPASDEQAVRNADDAFWRAFNACDAASMATFFAEDVEFYHDITGLTRSRPAVVASLIKSPCGTSALHMRREQVPQSVRYQTIPGYGAMLTGEHLFYARQGNAPERPATLARFVVIWKLQTDRWVMTRIVSYDHRAAPYVPSLAAIPVPRDGLKRYVGRYRTKASGDVDISLDNDVLVLRSGDLRVTLAASAPGHFFAQERDLRINFSGDPDISAIEIEEEGVVVARGLRVEPR